VDGFTLLVIKILLYIAPLYFANSAAMLSGGKTALDFGRKMPDGERILGEGKTIKGSLMGIAVGTGVAGIILLVAPDIAAAVSPRYLELGFLLAGGAIVGDIIASFFKRRSGIKPGTEAFVVDQLDFVVGGMLFGSVIYMPSFYEVIFIAVATLIIHRFTNFIAFKVKLKKVPW